ncbi:MAG: YIP1 family protein [Gemmatimonadota bacterium]
MIAWERDSASFPGDLFESWLHCMTRPFEFFDGTDPTVPVSRPLLFFLVFWIAASGLGTLSTEAALGGWYDEMYAADGVGDPGAPWLLFTFFLSPFVGLVSLALHVGLTNLGVRLFIPNGKSIGVTGRALCYAVAPQVVAIVPFLGWLAAPLWSLFLAVVAIRQVHAASTGRAAAAVLVPPFVFWFGIGLMFALLIVFFALAASGVA